jgi:hypothetical protein
VRYLLFPDEERALYRHLREDLRLTPLGGENLITDDFPNLKSPGSDHYFLCPEIGPVKTLGEAPRPRDAREAVMMGLNRAADPAGWQGMIDVARTPVIAWCRPRWYRTGCVVAGRLGSMATTRNEQPPALRRLHSQIRRWLGKHATRFNPFEHCNDLPGGEPTNLANFWVGAWPLAKEWIERGGELWPWDG